MNKSLSRRTFIAAAGLSSLTACGQKPQDSSQLKRHLELLLTELGQEKFASNLGELVFKQNKQQFNSQEAETLFKQVFTVSATQSDAVSFKNMVKKEIAEDFAADQLINIDGWILSDKESMLYALVYLHSS